jgi:hypothetical protein
MSWQDVDVTDAMQPGSGLTLEGPQERPATFPTRLDGMLTEADAIEIWIARWLRLRRGEILKRYPGDPSRLYQVWWGERFPASRGKAQAEFERRYPWAADRTAFGYRRIPRIGLAQQGDQHELFE